MLTTHLFAALYRSDVVMVFEPWNSTTDCDHVTTNVSEEKRSSCKWFSLTWA